MNIVVLVKQVPAISDIEIAKDNNLVRVGAPSMLNPVDKHAIEAAVAVKEAVGGTVTLLTMGNALAGEMMRDGIAVGADKGVLVSDERMAGSDTLATGLVLAKAIEKLGGADLYGQALDRRRHWADSSGYRSAPGHGPHFLCQLGQRRRHDDHGDAPEPRRHRNRPGTGTGCRIGYGKEQYAAFSEDPRENGCQESRL